MVSILEIPKGGRVRRVATLSLIVLTACSRTSAGPESSPQVSAEPAKMQRELRLTGIVEAVRNSKVTVPQIVGQNGRLTLTR